jgi:hypothetical protein
MTKTKPARKGMPKRPKPPAVVSDDQFAAVLAAVVRRLHPDVTFCQVFLGTAQRLGPRPIMVVPLEGGAE